MTLRTVDNSFQELPCEPLVPLTEEEEAEVDGAFASNRYHQMILLVFFGQLWSLFVLQHN